MHAIRGWNILLLLTLLWGCSEGCGGRNAAPLDVSDPELQEPGRIHTVAGGDYQAFSFPAGSSHRIAAFPHHPDRFILTADQPGGGATHTYWKAGAKPFPLTEHYDQPIAPLWSNAEGSRIVYRRGEEIVEHDLRADAQRPLIAHHASLRRSSDGQRMVQIESASRKLFLVDLAPSRPTVTEHDYQEIDWTPDEDSYVGLGDELAFLDPQATLRHYDLEQGRLRTIASDVERLLGVSTFGPVLYVDDGVAFQWDPRDEVTTRIGPSSKIQIDRVLDLFDGFVLLDRDDGYVDIWSIATASRLGHERASRDALRDFSVNAQGTLLGYVRDVSGRGDHYMHVVWETAAAKRHVLSTRALATTASYSPDGSTVAVADREGWALWSLEHPETSRFFIDAREGVASEHAHALTDDGSYWLLGRVGRPSQARMIAERDTGEHLLVLAGQVRQLPAPADSAALVEEHPACCRLVLWTPADGRRDLPEVDGWSALAQRLEGHVVYRATTQDGLAVVAFDGTKLVQLLENEPLEEVVAPSPEQLLVAIRQTRAQSSDEPHPAAQDESVSKIYGVPYTLRLDGELAPLIDEPVWAPRDPVTDPPFFTSASTASFLTARSRFDRDVWFADLSRARPPAVVATGHARIFAVHGEIVFFGGKTQRGPWALFAATPAAQN